MRRSIVQKPDGVSAVIAQDQKSYSAPSKAQIASVRRPSSVNRKVSRPVKHRDLVIRSESKLSPDINNWVTYFSVKRKGLFYRYMKNGHRFKEFIQTELTRNGLPKELYYLGMIESGYYLKARSRVGAQGPWQFMKGTAKQYGLRVDYWVDERRSVFKSTQAAIRYLSHLHNIFGSWELALAAYNMGEYGLIRSISKAKSRDFSYLKKHNYIPKETQQYISKFLAAVEVGQNASKYGIDTDSFKSFDKVYSYDFKGGIDSHEIAKELNISSSDLKFYNPQLKRRHLPPVSKYSLVLPQTKLDIYQKKITSLNNLKSYKRRVASVATGTHKVRRGESLWSISRKYKVSISSLKSLNNLGRKGRIYPGQKLKVNSHKSLARSSKGSIHIVKRGDNLSLIAKRYGTSVSKIKQLNNLSRGIIYPGQKLYLSKKLAKKIHVVKRGESLWSIARNYDTSIKALKSANDLSRDRLFKGQKLVIYKSDS